MKTNFLPFFHILHIAINKYSLFDENVEHRISPRSSPPPQQPPFIEFMNMLEIFFPYMYSGGGCEWMKREELKLSKENLF